MGPGDLVVYLPEPLLFGAGVVERTLPNGRIVVRFDADDNGEGGYEDQFDPQELELAEVWAKRGGEVVLLNRPARRAA